MSRSKGRRARRRSLISSRSSTRRRKLLLPSLPSPVLPASRSSVSSAGHRRAHRGSVRPSPEITVHHDMAGSWSFSPFSSAGCPWGLLQLAKHRRCSRRTTDDDFDPACLLCRRYGEQTIAHEPCFRVTACILALDWTSAGDAHDELVDERPLRLRVSIRVGESGAKKSKQTCV